MLLLNSGPATKAIINKNAEGINGLISDTIQGENSSKNEQSKPINQDIKENYFQNIFKNKLLKLFAKIKQRQRRFFSFQDSTVDLFLKELNTTNASDEATCAVTRTSLTSETTYFMYAQLHFSNGSLSDHRCTSSAKSIL